MQQYNKVQYNDAQYNDDTLLLFIDSHQYNRLTYNTNQYNASADHFVEALADSVTAADLVTFFMGKTALTDAVTLSDILAKLPDTQRIDNIFLSENFQREISNKGLSETVRLAAWFINNRYPGEDKWGDQ